MVNTNYSIYTAEILYAKSVFNDLSGAICGFQLSLILFGQRLRRGRSSVECWGYFVRPSVHPYVRTSICLSVHTPLIQEPWPTPPSPGPWPRPPGPGPPSQVLQAQTLQAQAHGLGLTGPSLQCGADKLHRYITHHCAHSKLQI